MPLLIILFAVTTHIRNTAWKDPITLWSDVVDKNGANARAHNNLGTAFARQNLTDEAAEQYRVAINLNPSYVDPHLYLGIVYMGWGENNSARMELETVLRLDSQNKKAKMFLDFMAKKP